MYFYDFDRSGDKSRSKSSFNWDNQKSKSSILTPFDKFKLSFLPENLEKKIIILQLNDANETLNHLEIILRKVIVIGFYD